MYLEEAAILRPASALRPRIHAALTGLEKLADGSRQDLTEDGIHDRITAANDLLKETIRLTLDYAASQKLPSKREAFRGLPAATPPLPIKLPERMAPDHCASLDIIFRGQT